MDTILFNTDDTAQVPPPLSAAQIDTRKVKIHPDHWYPVAWSREVKAGKTHAVKFAGSPIVLVRPKEGAVFALENRCAHRQVPLDAGVISGCAVRCGYHGWTYDASGKCIDVPYLGKGKMPNGVKSYPCREEAGLVFIFPGDPAKADASFPNLGGAANPDYKTRRFGREVACHYSFMHENLMDMNHQFLHRKQMGQIRPHYLGRRVGEDWLEVQYTFARTAGKQPLGEAAVFGGRRGDANDKDVMTIRTEYPYQTLSILTGGGDAPVMDLWIVYVPLDAEQRTIRTFGLLSIHKPKNPFGKALLTLGWPFLIRFTENIFREDRWIVEAEQAAHDAQGANLNQEVFPVIRELTSLLGKCGVVE